MAQQDFTGNANKAQLLGMLPLSAGPGSVFSVQTGGGSGHPTGALGLDWVETIDRGLPTEEKILCSARSGDAFTIAQRGYDGTAAVDHQNGASVEHTVDAALLKVLSAHVFDTTRHDHAQHPFITQPWTDEPVVAGTFTDLGAMTVTLVADARNHYRWTVEGNTAHIAFNQIVSFGGTFQPSVAVKLPAALTPAYKRIPIAGTIVNVIANAGTFDQLDRVTLARYDGANLTGGNAHLSFNGAFEVT